MSGRSGKFVWGLAVVVSSVLVSGSAYAQSAVTPRVEVSALPGGATFFTERSGEPSFGSYAAAAAVTYNANRFVGIEAEVGGNIGVSQNINLSTGMKSVTPPHQLTFSGNVLGYVGGRDRRVVPYVTAGAGGLTLFDKAEVGVANTTTFFAGNAGGGLLAGITDRVSLRVDYRFIAVASKTDAPAFFGRDDRFGHRITAGLTVNFGQ